MRRFPLLLIALALSLVMAPGVVSAATPMQSQSKPDPKPEQKPEPKPEPSFAGKWDMSIETPGGPRPATLVVKLDGKKVAGSLASEIGETPIAGELTDGTLAFSLTLDMNGQSITLAFSGTSQKDGSIAGTASMAGQQMAWTATRAKEK